MSGSPIAAIYPVPFGAALAIAEQGKLCRLCHGRSEEEAVARLTAWKDVRRDDDGEPFPQLRREMDEYFAGQRSSFSVPLALSGTDFYRRVWDELLAIPYGTTRSYGEIAAALGQPGASRAVGQANHNNPIGIIVPCHRVIGASGRLTGYATGLDIKHFLLDHERSTQRAQGRLF